MNIVDFLNKLRQKYRYPVILLKQLVITDFKIRYKSSILGYVWTLLRPLALFTVLYVVFVYFLKVGAGIPYYAVYLLVGVMFWNFFLEVTNVGVTSVVQKGDLLRKLPFPRYTIVIAGSISALINLLINLCVIALFMIINGVPLSTNVFMIIPLIFELLTFSVSVAFILSTLYVRFRDMNYIWEVITQVGFYATPVLYPITLIIEKSHLIAKIIMLNPLAQIIQDARYFVVTTQTTTIASLYGTPYIRIILLLSVVILAATGSWYFKKRSPYFAEDI